MKYKRKISIEKKYKYYKIKELFKLQILSLFFILLNQNIQTFILDKIYTLNKVPNKLKIRNYCIFSGRSRSLYSKIGISRIVLRDLSVGRLFSGLRKMYW